MDDLHVLEADEGEFDFLLALFAPGDHLVEGREDLARQQRLQPSAVAARKGRHDDLIGRAGAGEKVVDLESCDRRA